MRWLLTLLALALPLQAQIAPPLPTTKKAPRTIRQGTTQTKKLDRSVKTKRSMIRYAREIPVLALQSPRMAAIVQPPAIHVIQVSFDTEISPVISRYTLEATTDYRTWTNCATFPPSGYPAVFNDSTNSPAKYYRAYWTYTR